MRVLFIARSLNYGGAERQLIALAKGLHAAGHSVVVALFYDGGPLEKDLREAGVAVRSLGKRGRWDLFGFLIRLARMARSESPDIIHGYLVEPNILSVPLKLFVPRARVVWGIRASARDLNSYERFIRVAFRLQCCLSRRADLIIANSHAGLADHVARGFPRERMVAVSNGIDPGRFRPDTEERCRARSELGVRDGEDAVGIVARLDPMKDHPTFLNAAAVLGDRMPNVRFLCIGNGPEPYRKKLLALAEELGISERICWIPARADVLSVYRALDVLVSSSCWGEGFSNAIGEAMACGVPCVATDVGDSRLIVGDTGVVVAPGDHRALASGIELLLGQNPNQRADRGAAARTRVVAEFSVDRMVRRTEGLLRDLLHEVSGCPE